MRDLGERPARVPGLPPGLLGVDQQVVAAGLGVRAEADQAAPGARPRPGVRQHERLRAQRLDEQFRLAPGQRPGRPGQQHADLVRADPAEQIAGRTTSSSTRAARCSRSALRSGRIVARRRRPIGLDPDHQHGAAATAQRPVQLVGEAGPGQQAGRRVRLDHRGLHRLAAPGQPVDLAAGALAGGDVADRAADAADRRRPGRPPARAGSRRRTSRRRRAPAAPCSAPARGWSTPG